MKFFSLLKKEVRELLTLQSLIGIAVAVAMFAVLGSITGSIGESIAKSGGSVVIADLDKSETSALALKEIADSGMEVIAADISDENDVTGLMSAASSADHTTAMIIEKGFGDGIIGGTPQELKIYSAVKSFSIFSNMDSSASDAAEIVSRGVSSKIAEEQLGDYDYDFLTSPVSTVELTSANGKTAQISGSSLVNMAMSQSVFIPIIIFLLLTMATQLNISAIANEKNDKTLETLLSTPVSRLSVLGAKMTASALFAFMSAAVYMVGFSIYMSGMMGMTSAESISDIASSVAAASPASALSELGLSLSGAQFALIGVQLFLTVAICLVISLILGALSKDLKSAQSMITPLMIAALIPYLITMFIDVNRLPIIGQIIVYLIPFTHTFMASANLLFNNNLLFIAGTLYQLLFLCGTLFIAVRVFSSDKIFTASLSFGGKKRKTAAE